ncbi:pantoate--beta-alanine ligase [Arcticibacter pallidicorallinus]|uniref:Pantothenate synthetase n=1 Tax=Arcticibacter pallidicorallinus TaxID=1259464 RepID=A0A2T0U770_9SPHI|nr:pantoate--beta-alanine ligase [Arcticibacter pallidicorallinus]PRY53760.1 pantoate--beta-alanine ligase [Arcticibacter pallidicorallinus]
MKIFTSKSGLSDALQDLKAQGKQIGLVPTMGALHDGHISLIDMAKQQTDVVVCSIFVNPTQFTDPLDLEKYPRTVEDDIKKLEDAGCDILFLPEVAEMYGQNESWDIDLGYLETILEGQSRPGHYQGVTQIVYKLFQVTSPDKAFFGQKDYQQVLVITKMVSIFKLPVELVMCPIQRSEEGLALSSRNIHLSPQEKRQAYTISRALFTMRQQASVLHADKLKEIGLNILNEEPGINLDYCEILDKDTLKQPNEDTSGLVALIAAHVGKTRLIDNMILN